MTSKTKPRRMRAWVAAAISGAMTSQGVCTDCGNGHAPWICAFCDKPQCHPCVGKHREVCEGQNNATGKKHGVKIES